MTEHPGRELLPFVVHIHHLMTPTSPPADKPLDPVTDARKESLID